MKFNQKIKISLTLFLKCIFLFKLFHSAIHLIEFRDNKKCQHQYSSNTEICHSHKQIDTCFICDASYFEYFDLKKTTFKFFETFKKTSFIKSYYSFFSFKKNNIDSLRGPPIC